MMIRRYPDGQVQRLARGAQKAHEKGKVEPDNRAEDAAGQHTIHQCIGGAAAGQIFVIGPQRTRHQRATGNRHADPDRCGEEQDRAGIAHGRRKFRLAQHGDEDHVHEIDEEHGHQPDRRGQRHHRDVPEQVAPQEDRIRLRHGQT
jgi:hypothetical protein